MTHAVCRKCKVSRPLLSYDATRRTCKHCMSAYFKARRDAKKVRP